MERDTVVMTLGRGRWRWIYEGVMASLAILVAILLFAEPARWVRVVNLGIWAVFVADYVTRLALSTDRRAFFRVNIIDLIAIMPADFFRTLRVLRLARLLRVLRAVTVLNRLLRNVRGVTVTNGLHWVLLVATGSVILGGFVAWWVEPTITTLEDGLWWAVVTATTVGYGDLSPETGAVRVLAVVLMLFGIGTIGMITGSIATYFINDPGAGDPDIDHIRERLGSWGDLQPHERVRLVALLDVAARQPAGADPGSNGGGVDPDA